jgi:hypothetical protein
MAVKFNISTSPYTLISRLIAPISSRACGDDTRMYVDRAASASSTSLRQHKVQALAAWSSGIVSAWEHMGREIVSGQGMWWQFI